MVEAVKDMTEGPYERWVFCFWIESFRGGMVYEDQ